MKLIEKKDFKITFTEEIEESLINSIRRYVNEIPIIAVDEVEIHKNDSPLYDETIAHRIGLIPLEMDNSYDEKTEIELKLAVDKEGIVHAKELKGKAKVIFGEVPITTLEKDQELVLVAKTKVGKGNEHAKFSPGMIFYRNIGELRSDKNCDLCQDCVTNCPQNILKIENKKLILDDKYKCDICGACMESCKKHGKDAIQIAPSKELMITIESFGQLDTKDILNKSSKRLKQDLSEISKKIDKA